MAEVRRVDGSPERSRRSRSPRDAQVAPLDFSGQGQLVPAAQVFPMDADDNMDFPNAALEHMNDTLDDILKQVTKDSRISPDMMLKLQILQKGLASGVSSLLKVRERKKKIVTDTEALQRGELPSGVPPFRLKVKPTELQKIVGKEIVWELKIAHDCSIFDAKALIHRHALLWNRQLDDIVNGYQEEAALVATAYDKFTSDAQAIATKRTSTIASLALRGPPGLDAVPAYSNASMKAMSHKLYIQTVDKVAADDEKHAAKKEQIAKDKEKVVEKLNNRTPKQRWIDEVKSALHKDGKTNADGLTIDHSSIHHGTDPSEAVTASNAEGRLKWNSKKQIWEPKKEKPKSLKKPKNGQAPSGSGAQTQQSQSGMDNGKPKGKGKGKGKGKSNPQSSHTDQGKKNGKKKKDNGGQKAQSGEGKGKGGKGAKASRKGKGKGGKGW
eukprot:TRINITY_DN3042_c3_g1_i1.p3 TRINITY_DN3042_c3_g1~~TRINITY_DN3042_c3_g1_i1.p3  ORF type:complete len:440 (-),score=103.06 TRINITY_DN3042_c3_g1_i1:3415-4734(-)